MIKPVGALCNLNCTYCYYLPTKAIYPGAEHRMSMPTLEAIFAGMISRSADDTTIAWQGGEPLLAGLEFFRNAIAFQEQYARTGQNVAHSLQTNGTLLDDDWCAFFKQHRFLIGFSIDGPPRFHDQYRLTNRAQPSSKQVFRGLKLLQKHKVDFNILCVLNDANVDHPDEILDYLLNLGTPFLQFIPAIEWITPDAGDSGGADGGNTLAPYSPDPEAYGRFLCRVFDRWFDTLRHRVSVRIFDAVLNRLVLGQTPFCILDGRCHSQLTIEHDGAVFGCDHFVERRWQLAQIGDPLWRNPIALGPGADLGLTVHGSGYGATEHHAGRDIATARDVAADSPPAPPASATVADGSPDTGWFDRIEAERLGTFAARKQFLPPKCLKCQWKQFCHGGCPKHRPAGGEVAEASVLCPAYIMFYEHALPRLEWLAGHLRQQRQPPPPESVSKRRRR